MAIKAAGLVLLILTALGGSAFAAVNGTTFELTTEPAGANVFIDNQPVGKTPIRLVDQLEAGTHSLRVEKEGYRTFTRDFPISSVMRLNFRMVPVGAPESEGTAEPVTAPSPTPPKKSKNKKPRPDTQLPTEMKNPAPEVIDTPPPKSKEIPRLEKGVEAWDPLKRTLGFGGWLGFQTATLKGVPASSFLMFRLSVEAFLSDWVGVQLGAGFEMSAGSSGGSFSGFGADLGIPVYVWRKTRHSIFVAPQIGTQRHDYSGLSSTSRQARYGGAVGYQYLPSSEDDSAIGFSAMGGAHLHTDTDTQLGATSFYGMAAVLFAY